jgi:histidyl-tRNA synthetase
MNALENVSFDLSLARALSYYTGLIYERAVLLSGEVKTGTSAWAAWPVAD